MVEELPGQDQTVQEEAKLLNLYYHKDFVSEETMRRMSSSVNLKGFLQRPNLVSHLKYFLADDVRKKRDEGRQGGGFHIKKTVIPIPRLG